MFDVFIHPTASVSTRARLGRGTKVWINVQIREDVVLGENCIVSKDVYIDHRVNIGDRCKIQNSVSIYHGVCIENDVFIGPNACFTNDRVPRAFNADWKVVPTIVKNGASIGANSTLICGITVGEYAMVAAGSVVTHNVEPYTLVRGNPARPVARIDKTGNKVEEF